MILSWGSCGSWNSRELYGLFTVAMLSIGARHAAVAGLVPPFAQWVAEMQA
jgi:hypothetical protein